MQPCHDSDLNLHLPSSGILSIELQSYFKANCVINWLSYFYSTNNWQIS